MSLSGAAAAAAAVTGAATSVHAASHLTRSNAAKGSAAAADAVTAVRPMDVSDDTAPVSLSADARKLTAAAAAAAAYMRQQLSTLKGRYSDMHSSSQVLLLQDDELWDTITGNWCKPGEEKIKAIAESWEGMDLAACVHRLGLPVLYPKKGYIQAMRRSVIEAVRAHAAMHPELFESEEQKGVGDGSDVEAMQEEDSDVVDQSPSTPPRAASAAKSPATAAPVSPLKPDRRSPRANASSRSAAAAAVASLNSFVHSSKPVGAVPILSRSQSGPKPRSSKASRILTASASPVAVAAIAAAPVSRPSLDLLGAGAGSEEELSEDDSDEDLDDDPFTASLRNGGQLRKEEMEHQLALAGVQRSFATGFIQNAKFAAGGRSLFQLYTDVTSTFSQEARHSKRECLALARILDALLRKDYAAALEHTCRRLGGVHTAAETGNWAMCDRLETESEQRSFVPDAFMRSALKSVTQMQAVKKSVANGGGGKGGAGGPSAFGGKGRGDSRHKSIKKENSQGDNKGTGASASQKKKAGSGSA
jgi:hypothetical protein